MKTLFHRSAGWLAALLLAAAARGQSVTKNPATAGLWVGEVTLNEVTHARANTNAPTVDSAQLRLILHVGSDGTVRLLRDVTVVRKNVSSDTPPGSDAFPDGSLMLVTDPTKLPGLKGVIRRDGKLVGQRLATAAYDFKTPAAGRTLTGNELNLDGGLGNGFACQGRIEMPADHPTNPFKHRYHPDHAQGIALTRDLKIAVTTPQKNINGADQLNGTYEELITGLANTPLKARGTVVLRRLSQVAFLNQ